MVQGDTRPKLEFEVTKGGLPVDLTGCTVKFYMKSSTGTVKINGSACSITDAVKGLCAYSWQSADTNTAGEYTGEVEVTFDNGSIQTGFKSLNITIRAQI
jgi:hypothetical protein